MAYTKYSLTPADNNAAPPNGAPEGMLPSGVNDTMRDMMSQIRDAGDGIRDGTYTMTAAKITGGTITGVALTGNTFTSPVISGGSINNTPIGATTANTGAFSTASLKGSTSGVITLAAAAVAGTNTATFPAATGDVMVSGNMPAFSVALSGNQTINNDTFTKLTLNTEVYDTNNCYDPTTNYRFTPNVAGYYLINLKAGFSGTATRNYYFATVIYKNGSAFSGSSSSLSLIVGTGSDSSISSSMLIYMNGSSDYLEAYVYQYDFTATSTAVIKSAQTNFNGSLVRAA
jgi:hypothetical protein